MRGVSGGSLVDLHTPEPEQSKEDQHIDFTDVKSAFNGAIDESLHLATANIDQIISDLEPTAVLAHQQHPDNLKSFQQVAETFTTGAFNQISNNAMIGQGYTVDHLPDAHLSGKQLNIPKLKEFHTGMMDKLLTRLSGLDTKLRLHEHGLLSVRDGKMDFSSMQLNRLAHFGRTLATRPTHTFNAFIIRHLRNSVLRQVRNEGLRAGDIAFKALKEAMLEHYNDQSIQGSHIQDPYIQTLFANKNSTTAPMASGNGSSSTVKARLAQIQTALKNVFKPLIAAKNSIPNMREALTRVAYKARNPGADLTRLGKIEKLPLEHGLLSKAAAAHKMMYGLKAEPLDAHVNNAASNRAEANSLRIAINTTQAAIEKKEADLQGMSNKLEIKTAKNELRDLKYTKSIQTLRLNRAEKAYIADAKEVVRYTSPSKFEQKIAQHGFHATNDRASPSKAFSGTQWSSNTLRARLLNDTDKKAMNLPSKTALKTAIFEQLQKENKLTSLQKLTNIRLKDVENTSNDHLKKEVNKFLLNKSHIKVNAALVHAPHNPKKALMKVIDELRTSALLHAEKGAKNDLDTINKRFDSLSQAISELKISVLANRPLDTKRMAAENTLNTEVASILRDSSLDKEIKQEAFRVFGSADTITTSQPNSIDINTAPVDLRALFKGDTETALIAAEKKDAIEDYRAVFENLNSLMQEFTSAETTPERREALKSPLAAQVRQLMSTSDIADELTGTYNTLVASLNSIIGDPRTKNAQQDDTKATRALRESIPPRAASTGGMFLESSKTRATEDMANNFVKLMEVLSSDITKTSLVDLSHIIDAPDESKQDHLVQEKPKTVQELLKARALMKQSNTLEQVGKVFENARAAIVSVDAGASANSKDSDLQSKVASLQKTMTTAFDTSVNQKENNKALRKELTQVYTSLYKELNTIKGVTIKPNSRFWVPGSSSNERSIQHHVNILMDSIDTLRTGSAKQKPTANQKFGHAVLRTPLEIKPDIVTATLLSYMQSDLEHHFRQSDLDTVHMRDRMLWGKESPATVASSTMLATAMGDVDESGRARGVDDPQSILGELQRDFNRTVNMPAQIITQGVINAALVGSAFGSVPSMIINPLFMVTPTPFPFLNFGDFISMSTFGTTAAIPLTVISAFKSSENHSQLSKKDQALIQRLYNQSEAAQNAGTAEPTPQEKATLVDSFPKQLHARNSLNLNILQAMDKVVDWWNGSKEASSSRASHFETSGKPFNISGKGQIGRILNETRRLIGEDVLAQAAISTAKGAQLTGKMIRNDLLPEKTATQGAPIVPRFRVADAMLREHINNFATSSTGSSS